MPSSRRIADIPPSSRQKLSHPLNNNKNDNISASSGHLSSRPHSPRSHFQRSSSRLQFSARVDNNNAPSATDNQIIRITCGQIFQALNGASLNGEILKHIVEMRKIGFRGPIIGVSVGDKKTMEQFLHAGASNVIQKPAQSDKLVDLLLEGFRLVVQEETEHKPTSLSAVPRFSFTSPQERIKRLRKFLEEREMVK